MSARRTWLLAWLGGPLIGIANGTLRELAYKDRVGDRTAHQISTGSAIAFEFGFGRGVAHTSWDELLADYDVRRGRLWPLVLAWIAVGPATTRAAHRHCGKTATDRRVARRR